MSNATDGRGLGEDEFGDDEIEWDDEPNDETPSDDDRDAAPLEGFVGNSVNVVSGDENYEDDDED